MAAGLFLAFWVVLALAVFFVAMRGGPAGARQALHVQSRRGSRVVALTVAVIFVAFGVALPALVLGFNGAHKARVAPGGVSLNADQAKGRTVFASRCATCHTLAAARAVGRVGPNLDLLHPASALILDAIANGRARGNGQMPAQIVDGRDAQNVAAFVAAVAGH